MRIAIIGDLQNDTIDNIKKVAEDISALSPDYVIAVGDYGMYDTMVTYENFSEIAKAFLDVKCKEFVPLLGNHDVLSSYGRPMAFYERIRPSGLQIFRERGSSGY